MARVGRRSVRVARFERGASNRARAALGVEDLLDRQLIDLAKSRFGQGLFEHRVDFAVEVGATQTGSPPGEAGNCRLTILRGWPSMM